jgi:septal ring factor EnvC (AmiA/AmiB activator)
MKKFPLLAAVLLMAEAAIELKDGKFEANEEQLGQIEAALKAAADEKTQLTASHEQAIQAKDQEIQTLKAKIEELNKQPGDSTTHPINDGKVQEATPMDDFVARVNAAQKLYDLA